jgi:O-Antigen ligase.
MYGLKFAFIFGSIVAFFWFMYIGIHRSAQVLFLAALFPVLSLLYIQNYEWIFLYQLNEQQTESSLLRLASYLALLLYSGVIYTSILRNKELYIKFADYYVIGTLLASIIGVVLFYLVLKGSVSYDGLAPISAGVHIVNIGGIRFYRFNPGANVNEFSMILAYAIFLMPFTSFSRKTKLWLASLFLLLEFATLTRAAWLALVLASFVAFFFLSRLKRNFKYLFITLSVFIIVFILIYHASDQVRLLFESRTSMDIGASGQERLEKFAYVFNHLYESNFRLLFGYGWATNMYVHNVYLQLLYETGAFGLILFIVAMLLYTKNVFVMHKGTFKAALIACLVFIIVISLMHHILYHMQTWFILAYIAGVSLLSRDVRVD